MNPFVLKVFADGTVTAWQARVNVSLYQAAAMNANARWPEVISQNLASASIPGFKKQDLSFDAVQAGMMSQANPDPNVQFSLPRASGVTKFSQGEIRLTDVSMDVAIEGKGFFLVQSVDPRENVPAGLAA